MNSILYIKNIYTCQRCWIYKSDQLQYGSNMNQLWDHNASIVKDWFFCLNRGVSQKFPEPSLKLTTNAPKGPWRLEDESPFGMTEVMEFANGKVTANYRIASEGYPASYRDELGTVATSTGCEMLPSKAEQKSEANVHISYMHVQHGQSNVQHAH